MRGRLSSSDDTFKLSFTRCLVPSSGWGGRTRNYCPPLALFLVTAAAAAHNVFSTVFHVFMHKVLNNK